jgi:A1 cistron-splicing factor AAR2
MNTIANQAAVLLLDLPPKSLAGIDLLSFTTTSRFKGVRNLPQGWHFIFCSSTDSFSLRHASWFQTKRNSTNEPELHVQRWNAENEQLIQETNQTELMKLRANIGSIWKENLTPYRQTSSQDVPSSSNAIEEQSADWQHLTDCISPPLLSRILGTTSDHWTLSTASSAKVDSDDIPNLSNPGAEGSEIQQEKELEFLPIDLKRTWPVNATGRERTEAARDHSWYLNSLIEHHCTEKDDKEVIGELQFCFLMSLCLNNFSCLEQWKRVLSLLFTSFNAVAERPGLFVKAIRMVKLHVKHVNDAEGGFFDLDDEGGRLIKSLLRRFKLGLKEVESLGKQDVLEELEELETFLRNEFGWELDEVVLRHGFVQLEDGEMVQADLSDDDEDEETGEYAPTVVELTDDQLRSLDRVEELGENIALEDEEEDIEKMDVRY